MRLGVLPRILLALSLAAVAPVVAAAPAEASTPVAGPCQQGTLPHGALSLTCVPTSGWNGDLVVFAHGYVPSTAPLGFYNLDIASGVYLPDLVQGLGFAFATTSYRQSRSHRLPAAREIIGCMSEASKQQDATTGSCFGRSNVRDSLSLCMCAAVQLCPALLRQLTRSVA